MTAHSPWGASVAHRFFACPGSIALCRDIPNKSTSYSREGTAAHMVGEICLREGKNAIDLLGYIFLIEGESILVTEEMAEAVQVYVDTVRTDKATLGGKLVLEQGFDLSSVREGLFGTSDAVLLTPAGHLITYDYKHGAGVPVEVVGNKQLKYYSLGALIKNKPAAVKSVEAVIVQPRCEHRDGPVRRIELNLMDLLDFRADLIEAVEETLKPDAPLVVGDHCKFCPAQAVCPEQKRHAQEVARSEFARFAPPAPSTLTVEQLAQVLDRADLVEDWLKSVREYVHGLLEANVKVPGFKLVQKRANRYWKDESEAPKALELLGIDPDQLYEKKLISPAKADAILKTSKAKKALEPLWEKRSSGTTIAPESDPRKELAPSAQSDFAGFISGNSGQE